MNNPTYYETIVKSEIWKEWTKHAQDNLLFDMPESIECGWLSERHWEEFIKWVVGKSNKELLDNLTNLTEQIADVAPVGDWYLLPPNAKNVVGYITDKSIGDIAYKGKQMNIKQVIVGSLEQGIKKLL